MLWTLYTVGFTPQNGKEVLELCTFTLSQEAAKGFLPALLQKLVGEFFLRRGLWQSHFAGNLAGFSAIFSDPQNKGSNILVKNSEHFWCENS